MSFLVILLFVSFSGIVFISSYASARPAYDNVSTYEYEQYMTNLNTAKFYATDLCVSTDDVELNGYSADETLHSAALFDVTDSTVLEGYHLHEQLYPASTTKILTAYLTLKYGDLDDIVTVSAHAVDFPADAQVCGLQEGDQLSLYDLLCGLMLHSGNDSATAIAEHISGSEEAFVNLMNTEAQHLGATHTHFTNPHGLHSTDHYTTAYDLYLMFQACMNYSTFNEITAMDVASANITNAGGEVRTAEWYPTNFYSADLTSMPSNLTNLGGKTGTTDEAGNCLVVQSVNEAGNSYISMIMGAETKDFLYEQMNEMLTAGTK